jgi:hypothetical protein
MPKKPRNKCREKSREKEMSQADIERKTKEIQQALAEQRARRQSSELVCESMSMDARPVEIPGMVYDANTDRYFKRSHIRMSKSATNEPNKKKNRTPGVEESSICNVIDVLHQRCLGLPMQTATISRIAARSIQASSVLQRIEGRDHLDNIIGIKYHPIWGLAMISGGLFFTNPAMQPIPRISSRLTGIEWWPSIHYASRPVLALSIITPIFASIVRTFTPDNAHNPHSSEMVYMNPNGDVSNMLWADDSSLLLSDGEMVMSCRCDGFLPSSNVASFNSAVASLNMLSQYETNAYLVGLRNGSVYVQDRRVRAQHQSLSHVYSMPFYIDHMHPLSDMRSVVVRDVAGNIDRFDVRYPNKTLLTVCSSTSNTSISRSKFWVSSSEDFLLASGPSMVATGDRDISMAMRCLGNPSAVSSSAPQAQSMIHAYSLITPVTTLHTIPVPGEQLQLGAAARRRTSNSLILAPNSPLCSNAELPHNVEEEDPMRGAYICVDKQAVLRLR